MVETPSLSLQACQLHTELFFVFLYFEYKNKVNAALNLGPG